MKLTNLWWTAMVSFLLAACSAGAVPTIAPTQVLIPAPPTFTVTPIVATLTPAPILAPADVVIPQVTAIPENLQALVQQIINDLASVLRLSADAIQVVRIDPSFWTTAELGCDLQNAEIVERSEGYQVVLLANNNFYEYHTDQDTHFLRCEAINPTAAATLAVGILLELDPVAAALAGLAQQRVATELDLPVRRVRVLDMRALRWTDSSLGCPQPDQTYTQIEIDGYRIVVSAGDQSYIFHSDFDRLLPCAAEDEQLPS